jgi:hypothetical protein
MITSREKQETRNYVESFFGRTCERIAGVSNCIIESTEETLRQIMEVTNTESIGVWGDYPPVGSDGKPYVPPINGRILQDFLLWRLPVNQEYALKIGAYGRVDGFVMVVDARIQVELLDRTYKLAADEQTFEYYKYIAAIPEWIDEIGWAFIPLDKTYASTVSDALFITAPRLAGCTTELKRRLIESRKQCVELYRDHGECSFRSCTV